MTNRRKTHGKTNQPGSPVLEQDKALMELYKMGRDGFSKRTIGEPEKKKDGLPYGYGLGFITRLRLYLRTMKPRKVVLLLTGFGIVLLGIVRIIQILFLP